MSFLTGKKVVVMGVANKRSIAWGCAQALKAQGAEVIYTYQNDRMKKPLERLLESDEFVVECDVANDESIAAAFDTIKEYAGEIHGVVHAVAYANKEDLSGDILNISRDGYALAQDISSYSLIAVTKYAKPILAENAGIVTLSYLGAERAVPNYNMMGIAKAALESSVRYLAAELSPQKIRDFSWRHQNASSNRCKRLSKTNPIVRGSNTRSYWCNDRRSRQCLCLLDQSFIKRDYRRSDFC